MAQVRIKLPDGVEVDKTRLTSAVRFALQGTDPAKLWRLNDVPAIAQLEEGTYDEGMQDLAALYDEVVTGLDLPPCQMAQAVLAKALGRPEAPGPDAAALPAPEQALLPPEGDLLTPELAGEILADLRKSCVFPRAD